MAQGEKWLLPTWFLRNTLHSYSVNKALGNCQFSNGSAAEDSYLTGTKYNRQWKKRVGGDLN